MATRTIVTSQPDVACDVCDRRLLRGEQPDIFLAAGRRRTVCELCAPRAAHEGWMRERDTQSMTLPPLRPRRGRSLFERLPVPFKMRQAGAVKDAPAARTAGAPNEASTAASMPAGSEAVASEAYEFLDGYGRAAIESPPATLAPAEGFPVGEEHDPPQSRSEAAHQLEGAADASLLEEALAVFNASEYPRRVAGVARSLGAPEVNVHPAEHLHSAIVIVVAWELCWYRYEVDLSEEVPEARATAQGTELSELEREERVGNAIASESGRLALAGS